MALFQIAEPANKKFPQVAIGIDLGTTNSLVASVIAGKAQVLADDKGKKLVASAVRFLADEIVVGNKALNLLPENSNLITSNKRIIGQSWVQIQHLLASLPYQILEQDGLALIKTCQGLQSPVQIASYILANLKQQAEQNLGQKITNAIITVPAYFDDARRNATIEAAKLAGLNALRLLNEPTSAAIAYGLNQRQTGTVAVYDLGGGTFDLSILQMAGEVFEVLATGGNSSLGGDDFDFSVAKWWGEQYKIELNAHNIGQILALANKAIKNLTCNLSTSLDFAGQKLHLTRLQFEQLIISFIAQTLQTCKRVLRDAKLKIADIEHVILVGGATRIPVVRQQVAKFFAKDPLCSLDPDQVVALGAAIYADVLHNKSAKKDVLLLDVTPLSLGIETFGGLMEKIIPRNTVIPCSYTQQFTTYQDGQTALSLAVFQGERELTQDCLELARFELRGITPMVAGVAKIAVTFSLDENGILSVSAQELNSNACAQIKVAPAKNLNEGQIRQILEDSIAHALEDKNMRSLRETVIDAQRLLIAVDSALEQDGHLLSAKQYQQIAHARGELRQTLDSQDKEQIMVAQTRLAEMTDDFAGLRMNNSIQQFLAGKDVHDL